MFMWLMSGSAWVWLTGGAVSISLLSVLGLLLLIGWKGLSYFWPAPLYQWKTEQGDVLIGQLYAEEYVPISHLREMDIALTPEVEEKGLVQRLSIKIANRDIYPADFVSILEVDLLERSKPEGWAVIERTRGGDFYGQPKGYFTADGKVSEQAKTDVESALVFADKQRTKIDRLVEKQIKVISAQADRLRLEKKRRELNGRLDAEFIKRYDVQSSMFSQQLAEMESQLDALRLELAQQGLIVEDMKGNQYRIPLSRILDVWYPNQMTVVEKVAQWAHQAWKFLSLSLIHI